MARNYLINIIISVFCFLIFIFIGLASPIESGDFMCGDVNGSGGINILDVTYLINYLYKGGPAPEFPEAADVNMSGSINILDISYIINYLYKGGPEPVCEDPGPGPDELPETFDLRDVDGENYVTSVKLQRGGTCWAFGTMGSVESNLLMTGAWAAAGETGEPDLAEYHLDWWNGFNDYWNPEVDSIAYVLVHNGGDFQMSSAYFSRGDGAVRDIDGQSYSEPPDHYNDTFHYFYVRDIEWYSSMMWSEDSANIELIKEKLMEYGGIGTCLNSDYINNDYICYVPYSEDAWGNHVVTIVGWDDNKVTPAPEPGAWLCKNSWGGTWGIDGYFWTSYYDKICGREPTLGAVSFHNVVPLIYDSIYAHDIHGWYGPMEHTYEAFNVFTTDKNELLMAVNIVTLEDSVDYTVTIYDTFDGSTLSDELTSFSGWIEFKGFHTIDLPTPLELSHDNDFYIHVYLSNGIMAYDYSTYVENMPGADGGVFIESKSKPKQSYYKNQRGWNDLYNFDQTANFCIKGLVCFRSLKVYSEDSLIFEGPQGGPIDPTGYTIKFTHRYNNPINFVIDPVPGYDWLVLTGDISGSLAPGDTGEVTVTIDESMTAIMTQGQYNGILGIRNLDYPEDDVELELKLKLGTASLQEEWLLDSDPGWTCEGDWAFGSPTGGGGYFGFGTDPVGGYTGDNVYGYNIDGNYPLSLPETHLTSEPIDCSKLFNVRFNFQKWLAVDGFGIGHVKASNDGINWHTLWTGYEGVYPSWEEMDIDISHIADFQPTVYLRWTMVVIGNPLYTFGGWSLDDIKIIAVYDSTMTSPPVSDNTVTTSK